MNSVCLTGRLTKDPEIKKTERNGSNFTTAIFTLAVNRKYKIEGSKSADFIRCVAFGRTGDVAEKYYRKGMKIDLRGHIQTGSYKNKDGQTVYTTDVIVDEAEFGESKSASEKSSGYAQTQAEPMPKDDDEFMKIPDNADDEGLPFNL